MTSMKNTLLTRAFEVRERAYAPYSHFHVGAAIIAANGKIYAGCNVENASYGLSICAEMNAVTQMIADGERQIIEVLIVGGSEHLKRNIVDSTSSSLCAPCGACRQTIIEFAEPKTPVHLCSISGLCQTTTIGELLPFAFNSKSLFPTPPGGA